MRLVTYSGKEDEDLLVGEAVEGSGEAAHAGGEGQVGVRQGRAHQVGGVGRDVAALVVTKTNLKNWLIPMLLKFLNTKINFRENGKVDFHFFGSLKFENSRVDGQVKTHELGEHGVLVADHLGEVVGPILLGVDGGGGGAVLIQVVVDGRGHHGQLGDEVHGVLVDGVPVLGLVDAVGVGLGELGLGVHGGDGRGELRHRVEVRGEVVQHVDHVGGEGGAAGPLLGHGLDLWEQLN